MSTSALKLFGFAAMTLDHIGAVFFPQIPLLRILGRTAMPVFCFCIAQGFRHTSDVQRYGLRLLFFALLSEIPFDLAFYGRLFFPLYQNVFFTLFCGLFCLYWADCFPQFGWAGILLSCIAAQFLLCSDYGAYGVLLIVLFYYYESVTWDTAVFMALLTLGFFGFSLQLFALLALPVLYYYNREKGAALHRYFYLYYPVHLLILAAIKFVI